MTLITPVVTPGEESNKLGLIDWEGNSHTTIYYFVKVRIPIARNMWSYVQRPEMVGIF